MKCTKLSLKLSLGLHGIVIGRCFVFFNIYVLMIND